MQVRNSTLLDADPWPLMCLPARTPDRQKSLPFSFNHIDVSHAIEIMAGSRCLGGLSGHVKLLGLRI
jgi:hypothetical protein